MLIKIEKRNDSLLRENVLFLRFSLNILINICFKHFFNSCRNHVISTLLNDEKKLICHRLKLSISGLKYI